VDREKEFWFVRGRNLTFQTIILYCLPMGVKATRLYTSKVTFFTTGNLGHLISINVGPLVHSQVPKSPPHWAAKKAREAT